MLLHAGNASINNIYKNSGTSIIGTSLYNYINFSIITKYFFIDLVENWFCFKIPVFP